MIACPGDHMIWGVPVMHNSRILGGLVVKPCIVRVEGEEAKTLSETLTLACDHLLELAEKYNLTNASYLKLNRIAAFVEREKAEAIHESKQKNHSDLQQLYRLEEPSLLYAIQQGQRNHARAIINRLLLHIYHHKPANLNFLKSFALELVIMMSRTAVEAGVDPARIMAMNSGHFSTLTGIDDEEELSPWMNDTLGRLMDEIQAQRRKRSQVHLSRAIGYIKKHLAENIRRDVVARRSGLSPGHFSLGHRGNRPDVPGTRGAVIAFGTLAISWRAPAGASRKSRSIVALPIRAISPKSSGNSRARILSNIANRSARRTSVT